MTHPLLSDPENAKAYQLLCDRPTGSIRSWAARAGWTKARMERFILQLKVKQLARIDSGPMGSIFVPLGVSDSVSDSVSLGSTAVKATADKRQVSRYGESPDEKRLLTTANAVLRERGWPEIDEYYNGSLAAARKILKAVPVDRAIPLLEQAVRVFNPSSTGGESLKSLGHPFIARYVVNEYRRTQRDLERGQLPILFLDRTPVCRTAVAPLDEVGKPEPASRLVSSTNLLEQDWRTLLPKPRRA